MSKRATYQDVLDAPERFTAELVDGELWLQPHPAPPHVVVASGMGIDLGAAFWRGNGGPGGWIFLDEPELWLGPPSEPRDTVLVPDLAAWRIERWALSEVNGFTVPPDFVAEVLSPSTHRRDRLRKLPIYAAAGIGHAWLVDPIGHTVEVYALRDGVYAFIASAEGAEVARLPPFDAVALDVGRWWPATSTS